MVGVSVVIPTAQPRFLDDCLAGLARQRDRRFEVIVVENGDVDPRVRAEVSALAAGFPARYAYQRRPGLNRARNRGCREARYPLIALIDDDCIPGVDWIGGIISHHQRFPDAGLIGGQVRLRYLADPPAWLTGEFLFNLCRVSWGERIKALGETEFIAGANMSFHRRVFDRVGGFDEGLGLSGRALPQLANDETLFNHRAQRSGCAHILYAPGIVVQHQIPAERLGYEYHEARRYGQGVSDIDLAIRENPQDPFSGHEKFRQAVQHQQWHRRELLKASRCLEPSKRRSFRARLVRSRVVYLAGAQDRILNRFAPGSLVSSLSLEETGAYQAGREAVRRRCSPGHPPQDLHRLLQTLLYRRRARHLSVREPLDRGMLHARVAFLKGFKDQLFQLENPPYDTHHLHQLEEAAGQLVP